MKNSLAVIAGLALMGAAANADVAFNANNYGSGAGPITGLTADGWVEILYTPTGGAATSLGVFQPTEATFFDNGGMSIPGATGTTASLTVQAWTGATTYAAATVKGSVTFNQAVQSWDPNASPPAPKVGPDLTMPGFALGSGVTPIVPEPSTIALGMLGAAALLIRRRK
jgi:hypothetical protein